MQQQPAEENPDITPFVFEVIWQLCSGWAFIGLIQVSALFKALEKKQGHGETEKGMKGYS